MRAQVSLEFIIVMGMAVLMLVVLLTVGSSKLEDAAYTRRLTMTQDILSTVQFELITALSVHDGYNRTFDLPLLLDGQPYVLTQTNDTTTAVLTVERGSIRQSAAIPLCTGSIVAGQNTITKENGSLRCNS